MSRVVKSVLACYEASLGPAGVPVLVQGWVRHLRTSKAGLAFVELNDGSCVENLQLIFSDQLPDCSKWLDQISTGVSLSVEGQLVATPGREQDREVKVEQVKWLGGIPDPSIYPLAPKEHSLEHLRQWMHLRPRTHYFQLVSMARNAIFFYLHQFFQNEGFYWVGTPILTSADCEGAGETFRVLGSAEAEATPGGFFGEPAYLTVSGQLNGECYACALSKIYTFGPTFRAELSYTSRHLSEFWMLEPEVAFCDLPGIRNWAEKMLRSVARACLDHHSALFEALEKVNGKPLINQLVQAAEKNYAVLDYNEIIAILKRSGVIFEHPVYWGVDLATEHERYLAEQYVGGPVFVCNYPKEIKAFYMKACDDGRTVASFDLLVPGLGEVIGGSQREENLAQLESRMEELKLSKESLRWYLDLRRYGSVVHSGFGLGFERLVSYLCGVGNVRDVIPFPRTPKMIPC